MMGVFLLFKLGKSNQIFSISPNSGSMKWSGRHRKALPESGMPYTEQPDS